MLQCGSRLNKKLVQSVCSSKSEGGETSYAPARPEIVYCEACYNAEVA